MAKKRIPTTDVAPSRATNPPLATAAEAASLADLFANEIEAQLQARAEQEDRWERWLKCYAGQPKELSKTYPWPNASNLVVNLGAIYVDKVAAQVMQSLFGVEPHWTAREINKKWADAADPYERYLDWQRQHSWDQYHIVKPFVLETLKLGTGVIHTGWVDEPLLTYNQQTRKMVKTGQRTGPSPCWVPREDFLIPQGYSDIQTAPWVAYRQWYSKQELRQLDYLEQIDDFDKLVGSSDDETPLRRSRREMESGSSTDEGRNDEFGLWSPWQVWCNYDLDEDGYAEPLILLLHVRTKALLRIVANPYLRGMRSFVSARFIEREGMFDGIGIPEMVEMYQEEVTTIHNQRRDNSHLANTSMAVARKGSGINRSEKIFPGRIFLVNGNPREEITDFQVGRVNPITIQEEELTTGYAERRIGISDSNLGQMTSPMGRAAASTMMAVMQEGNDRRSLSTAEIRRALTEHGQQITELYKTHGLPAPDQPESPEGLLDPEDAKLVRSLFAAEDPMRGLIALQINVATAAVNREAEKQSSLQLLGVVTQYFMGFIQEWQTVGPVFMNPGTPPPIKQAILSMVTGIDRAMRGVLQSHQRYDLEGILVADLLAELAATPQPPMMPPQLGGPAGQGGASATGLPGGMGQDAGLAPNANGGLAGANFGIGPPTR
jgi:hypothetical protein